MTRSGVFLMKFKGSLKYLVAKLHGCYPSAISVSVCFALFATLATERGLSRCEKTFRDFHFLKFLKVYLCAGRKRVCHLAKQREMCPEQEFRRHSQSTTTALC